MIKIEKRNVNGEIIPLSDISYTIESNFTPKTNMNAMILNQIGTSKGLSDLSTEDVSYIDTSVFDGMVSMTQNVYQPLSTGCIMLKNKSNYEYGAFDLTKSNCTSVSDGVLGVADINLGWINTTDSFRGSYNPADSKYIIENGKHKIKHTFDFHTDSSIGEINEIEYYAKPLYTSNSASITGVLQRRGAYSFSNGCMSFVDPSKSMELSAHNSGIGVNVYGETDIKLDKDGNMYRYSSNNSEETLHIKYATGEEFSCKYILTNAKKIQFDGITFNYEYSYWFLMELDGDIYLVLNKSVKQKNTSAFSTPRYYIPITNIIAPCEEYPNGLVEYGEPKKFVFTDVSQLPVGWVSAGATPSLSEGYKEGAFLILNNKYYLVIGNSDRKNFAFVEVTKDFEILKSHTTIRGTHSGNSSGSFRIYPYYDEVSKELFIHIPYDYASTSYDNGYINVFTYRVDSSLDGGSILPYTIFNSLVNIFIKYPGSNKVYTFANVTNPTSHSFRLNYHGAETRRFFFGEMVNTTANPLIKIKLDSPITKEQGEYLKISLDIEVE